MPPTPRFVPDRSGFLDLARRGRLCFVYREVLADSDTPVSAFAKLGRGPYSFLLESVVGGEKWAAYSFVGVKPRAVIRARGTQVQVLRPDGGAGFRVSEEVQTATPLAFVDDFLAALAPAVPPGLPRFFGGAVGWLGYDIVRTFEKLPSVRPDDLQLPELCFAITDTVVIFDNLRGTLKVVAAVDVGPTASAPAPTAHELGVAYDDACARIDAVLEKLARPAPPLRPLDPTPSDAVPAPRALTPRDRYEAGVGRIQEYIRAGDAFQVVYSQRFEVARGGVDPFDVYRALRVTNPSPYMFHLEFPEAVVTGASPECLVRAEAGEVEVRPLAGTRKRGATPEEDDALADELAADPKERAEHVMLIDLGRNDVGRVSAPGTVRIDDVMKIERYSHVMHISSHVRGKLRAGVRPSEVIGAAFPAGTLSGAPKIRAMEIIEELEPSRRGIYGGAVGYVSYSGNIDLAIAIRTLVTKDDMIYVQAGAGIVADSVPAAEHQECVNKARAVLSAVEIAGRGKGAS
jgi:anthranilate synthase component 1